MKLTKLRTKDGSKLTKDRATEIAAKLGKVLAKAGFITSVTADTHTQINISKGGCAFVIDTDKLGYNYRECRYHSLVGWKRSNTPTWDERVDFNDTLNATLDFLKLRCNIKAGPYTVRTFDDGARTECDWQDEKPMWQHLNEDRFGTVEKLSDDMVADAKEKRKQIRRERTKAKRAEHQAPVTNETLRLVVNN